MFKNREFRYDTIRLQSEMCCNILRVFGGLRGNHMEHQNLDMLFIVFRESNKVEFEITKVQHSHEVSEMTRYPLSCL